MRVAAVGTALPERFYDQETLLAALAGHWRERYFNVQRIEQLHRNALVGGRHLALPLEEYPTLATWGSVKTAAGMAR